jgi:AraC family transcriptional regulator, arabinose operon regulatory protein
MKKGLIIMYGYSGSVLEDNVYLGHRELSIPYFINCCGYLKLDDFDVSVNRTRMDFYLIYLINGEGHYITGNTTITAQAGSIIIYRPDEHQKYFYNAIENAELYWIHFTGGQAESLMDELDFTGSNFFQVRIHAEFIELFENIIHELQIKKPHFHQLCISYLLQLLSSFSRDASALRNGEKIPENSILENVIKVMNEEFHQEHEMEYYAKKSELSLFQFIRNIKKLTRYSPAKYIEKLRIAKAKELLRDSSLSITKISAIVGYKDPFYFSKVFKKASGITPSEFRNRL